MLHIGVTGGIGSGKSTFLSVWEQHGVPVVYADDLAKELMATDVELKEKIAGLFGDESYLPDGTLNRTYLAQAAFGQGRVEDLNKIVHPVVYRELEARKQKEKKVGARLFAHESALLLSSGRSGMCDVVILIACSPEERIRRVSERDNAGPETVQSRMQQQPDFDKLADRADLVVCNDGTPDILMRKAEVLLSELSDLAKTTENSRS